MDARIPSVSGIAERLQRCRDARGDNARQLCRRESLCLSVCLSLSLYLSAQHHQDVEDSSPLPSIHHHSINPSNAVRHRGVVVRASDLRFKGRRGLTFNRFTAICLFTKETRKKISTKAVPYGQHCVLCCRVAIRK